MIADNFNGTKDLITRYAQEMVRLEIETGKADTELLNDPKVMLLLQKNVLTDRTHLQRIQRILQRQELQKLKMRNADGSEQGSFVEAAQAQVDQMNGIMDQLPELLAHYQESSDKIEVLKEQQNQLRAARQKHIVLLTQAATKQLTHLFKD